MKTSSVSFIDELTKLGGIGGALSKVVGLAAKNPLKTLGVGMIVAPTAMAYHAASKQGLEGGEKPRYLAAGRDESGRIRPSEAAYVNYHDLFEHKPHPREVRALSKNYKPDMFTRSTARTKEK